MALVSRKLHLRVIMLVTWVCNFPDAQVASAIVVGAFLMENWDLETLQSA